MRKKIRDTYRNLNSTMKLAYRSYPIILLILLVGCQAAPKKDMRPKETTKDVISALGTVAEGLTNQSLSEKDLKNLAVQIQKDPEARSALNSVNQALSVEQVGVKYCPKDGKRFSSRLIICPEHKVELKNVE